MGQTSFQTKIYLMIVKYWLKIVLCPENRLYLIVSIPDPCTLTYFYQSCLLVLNDIESMPQKENRAKLVNTCWTVLVLIEYGLNKLLEMLTIFLV